MIINQQRFERNLTKFFRQVTLSPQLPFVIFIVVKALQGLAVVLQQGELGANEWQLDRASAGQSLDCIF